MKIKSILLALILYMFFSLSSVFMKLASLEPNLVYKIIFFGCSIVTLAIFSIAWQILLKKYDLSKVYCFKATTIIWGMLYGFLIFKEEINFYMIIGALITIIGVVIVLEDKKSE